MDAIFKRRSIRKYTDQAVPLDTLHELVHAGLAAPSSNNQQPWHFIIITDRKTLDAVPQFHPYSAMITQAPAAILVCGDTTLDKSNKGVFAQDCAAATENILIAATSLGLGSVWLGVYPNEARMKGLRDLIGVPDHVIPFALIPIGHPAEEKAPKSRFDASRIRVNHW